MLCTEYAPNQKIERQQNSVSIRFVIYCASERERERDSELECAKRMMRTTQYALVNIKLIYSAEHTHTLSHTFRKSFKVFRMRSTSSLYR